MRLNLSTTFRYTTGGTVFGALFPIFALLIDALLNDIPFGPVGIIILHDMNVIHYIVDTAPLVLGTAGYLLGRSSQRKKDFVDRLRRINHSLDTFTFKITHDLRSPALNVKGLVDILKAQQEDLTRDDRKELLDKLDTSVVRWLDTFKDFVELLKEEKTGIRQSRVCHFNKVLKDVKSQLHLEIEQSQAIIHEDFSRCKTAYASPSDLNSIIKNLISNAIKYTAKERTPEIHIQSIRNGREAIVMIEDNGIGIDLEEHGQRIFKLFERIDNEVDAEGTGVGLYLIKEQLEKNRGTIEVDSAPDEGTTFTLTLPVSGPKRRAKKTK